MGPKGISAKLAKKHSFIGQLATEKKKVRDAESSLQEQRKILKERLADKETVSLEINELSKSISKQRVKLQRKKNILNSLKVTTNSTHKNIASSKSRLAFFLSTTIARHRKSNPTSANLPLKAKFTRRKEKFDAATIIHGASKENLKPAVDGLLDTLTAKCKSKELSDRIFNSKQPLFHHLQSKILGDYTRNYSTSNENLLRSLNTYYCHNVMGKEKYRNVRKANRKTSKHNHNVPNYVTYSKLSEKINEIDIDIIENVYPALTNENVEGIYRPIDQYSLRLAKFYLRANVERFDKLKTFDTFAKKDEHSFLFNMSFGGDGAPISGCIFLLSFINVGNRIASSKENFVVFGSSVDESSVASRNFVLKVVSDIKYLESKVFDINVNEEIVKVEFKLCELPNDMKMLAFLAGELTNSSYYFTTFVNVNQSDANDITKKFGKHDNDWKPFNYSKRVEDSKSVILKKKGIGKK